MKKHLALISAVNKDKDNPSFAFILKVDAEYDEFEEGELTFDAFCNIEASIGAPLTVGTFVWYVEPNSYYPVRENSIPLKGYLFLSLSLLKTINKGSNEQIDFAVDHIANSFKLVLEKDAAECLNPESFFISTNDKDLYDEYLLELFKRVSMIRALFPLLIHYLHREGKSDFYEKLLKCFRQYDFSKGINSYRDLIDKYGRDNPSIFDKSSLDFAVRNLSEHYIEGWPDELLFSFRHWIPLEYIKDDRLRKRIVPSSSLFALEELLDYFDNCGNSDSEWEKRFRANIRALTYHDLKDKYERQNVSLDDIIQKAITSLRTINNDECFLQRLNQLMLGQEFISKKTIGSLSSCFPHAFRALVNLQTIPEEILKQLFYLDGWSLQQLVEDGNIRYCEREKERIISKTSVVPSVVHSLTEMLTDEQFKAVVTDEDNYLVVSSAGSGKSTVIANKFWYLVNYRHVDKKAICILSYTKAAAKEMNDKLGFSEGEDASARTFHSFAWEILHSYYPNYIFLDKERKQSDKKDSDHSPRSAVLFDEIYHSRLWNSSFKKGLRDFVPHYFKKNDTNKYEYLTFMKDRNGKIGSVRSREEKELFEYLALHRVEFEYERKSEDERSKPDFTIFKDGKFCCYYEHFAVNDDFSYSWYGSAYLSSARKKKRELRGNKKGGSLIFTTSGGKEISEIKSDLVRLLKDKLNQDLSLMDPDEFIRASADNERDGFINELGEAAVTKCLDLFDIIRERDEKKEAIVDQCIKEGGETKSFMENLFKPVISYYEKYLDQHKMIDYPECFRKAIKVCSSQKITLPWDYILIDEYQDISNLRFAFIQSLFRVKPSLKTCSVGDDWQSIFSFADSELNHFRYYEDEWKDSAVVSMSETLRFNDPAMTISSEFIRNNRDPQLRDKLVLASKKPFVPRRTEIISRKMSGFEEQVKDIANTIVEESLTSKQCLFLYRYNKYDGIRFKKELLDLSYQDGYEHLRDLFNAPKEEDRLDSRFQTIHSSKGMTSDKYTFIINCNEGTIPSTKSDDVIVRLIRGQTREKKEYEERRLFYVAITRAKERTFLYYSERPSKFIDELKELGIV